MKVLHVEDNDANQRVVKVILDSQGVEVITTSSAEDGVSLAEIHLPDLILMDIQLPGMNGLEATARLKGNAKTNGIPIVVVSAYAQEADILAAYQAGCSEYLTKPIQVDSFLKMVSHYKEKG